jgi:hypothetical protein
MVHPSLLFVISASVSLSAAISLYYFDRGVAVAAICVGKIALVASVVLLSLPR